MTVGGRQAKMLEQYPGPCGALDADVSITVDVDRGPYNYYRVWACLRAPGTALAESWVKRILASTTIKAM
jgi:hypothetical protein